MEEYVNMIHPDDRQPMLMPLLYNLVVIQLLTKQFHSVCAGGWYLGMV